MLTLNSSVAKPLGMGALALAIGLIASGHPSDVAARARHLNLALPLDAEAQRQAATVWPKTLTKCGSTLLGRNDLGVFEQYGGHIKYEIAPVILTEEDRANGWEWLGEISMTSSLIRITQQSLVEVDVPHWSEWVGGQTIDYEIGKKRGQPWEVVRFTGGRQRLVADLPDTAPKCQDAPGLKG